uniref:S1 family peptidase n=1 Tax=Streptomyces sp. NBC_00003 TaxID=2903608 RepID=A0AAU2UVT4_9ACTN
MPIKPPRTVLSAAVLSAAVAMPLLIAPDAGAVAGDPAKDNTYAFTTRLVIGEGDPQRACSGTLVSGQWVLTAKSCFADTPGAGVDAGKPKLKATATINGRTFDVVELAPRAERDVVLAKLAQRIPDVTPVSVATAAPTAGEQLRVTGFGRTESEWVPNQLRTSLFSLGQVSGSSLNLAPQSAGAAICQGDTGGPALRPKPDGSVEIAAISSRSWQAGCLGTDPAEKRADAISTGIHDLAGWIARTTSTPMTAPMGLAAGKFTATGQPDLIGTHPSGTLQLFPGAGHHTAGQPVTIGSGWGGMSQLTPGEFAGNKHSDLLALDKDGTLWAYPGTGKLNGTQTLGNRVQIGRSWQSMTLLAAGDFTGHGNRDLLALDKDGTLWAYPGTGKLNGTQTLGNRVQIGRSWQSMTLLAAGDFAGNGRSDLIARDKDGTLWAYPGTGKLNGTQTLGNRVQIGRGWQSMTLFTAGDFAGTGHTDLVTRDTDGAIWAYPGSGKLNGMQTLGNRIRMGLN